MRSLKAIANLFNEFNANSEAIFQIIF